MPQVLIENPILNSPYKEPSRHFKFSDEGITNEIAESRRISSYFIPIAPPKKKGTGKQLALNAGWTQDRIEENEFINRIRQRVSVWRQDGYVGITKTTRYLLDYWTNPDRERKLFFCQIEALETAIYLSEVASKFNDGWIENTIREQNEANNPGLYRVAFKMATGSGKTVVMAMLIAWQVLNKLADPQNAKFADSFLIVTPGITIRDVYATSPYKCHLNYMVADTESWEQKMAQSLEDMDEVICYVKNQGLEFTIPYIIEGEEKKYYPDFIVRLKDAGGEMLNLIVEVTGEKKKEKVAKVAAARNLWVPAINNHGGFGRWAFIEISDPWDAKNTIRAFLIAHSAGLTKAGLL